MMHVTFVNGSSLSVQRALTDTTQRGGRNTTGTVYLLDRPLKKYHGLHVICQVMWKGVFVDKTSHTFFIKCKYVIFSLAVDIRAYCLVSTRV